MKTYALTVTCPSARGVVAAIANYLADQGCNISDSAQFDDKETGGFFMRVSFESEAEVDLATLSDGFADAAPTPDDLFTGMALAPALRVVIYDDDHDYLANALAADLAAQGMRVELVSPMPSIAAWMGYTLEQLRMLAALIDAGVGLHPNTVAGA